MRVGILEVEEVVELQMGENIQENKKIRIEER